MISSHLLSNWAIERNLLVAVALAALCNGACGYRAGAHSSAALPNVRTIAVPMFLNQTGQFRLEQTLTAAVIHEFLAHTSYRVQSNTEGSDAILHGTVLSITSGPIVYDTATGRTTKVLLTVGVRVSLTDGKTGQPIVNATDVTFREPYEVSTDPTSYFAENAPALERLSREVAASVVTTIVQNF